MLKRFLLFRGADYYPAGGWHDFGGSFDTIEAAQAAAGPLDTYDWCHIVDTSRPSLPPLSQREDGTWVEDPSSM